MLILNEIYDCTSILPEGCTSRMQALISLICRVNLKSEETGFRFSTHALEVEDASDLSVPLWQIDDKKIVGSIWLFDRDFPVCLSVVTPRIQVLPRILIRENIGCLPINVFRRKVRNDYFSTLT